MLGHEFAHSQSLHGRALIHCFCLLIDKNKDEETDYQLKLVTQTISINVECLTAQILKRKMQISIFNLKGKKEVTPHINVFITDKMFILRNVTIEPH